MPFLSATGVAAGTAAAAGASSAAAGISASTVAAVAGATMSAAAAILSGIQQSRAARSQSQANAVQARMQSDLASHNQRILEQQAQATEKAGQYAEDVQRKKHARILGAQKAGYAASGVTMEGTPLEVMSQTAADMELEAIATRYNYAVDAARFRNQASVTGYEGEMKSQLSLMEAERLKSMASGAVVRGYLGAGTTLLTTAGALYGKTTTKLDKYSLSG